MQRIRIIAGMGVVVALAVAVGANLDHRQAAWWQPPPGITVATPATLPGSTTTVPSPAGDPAEDLVRNLYLGWLDAIFRDDRAALERVVATEPFLRAGVSAMDTLRFAAAPTVGRIDVTEVEVLHETGTCMAVWSVVDLSPVLGSGAMTSGVDVLWRDDGRWRFATSWKHRDDLWAADCEGRE